LKAKRKLRTGGRSGKLTGSNLWASRQKEIDYQKLGWSRGGMRGDTKQAREKQEGKKRGKEMANRPISLVLEA